MVRLATLNDVPYLVDMLKAMAVEVMPEAASTEYSAYVVAIFKYIKDPEYYVYVDDEHRGFFVVKDDYDPVFPAIHRYIGTKVYIAPPYRKGKLLKQFYAKLFDDFPEGDILGLTEIGSEHIKVLNKRHRHIANVYILNR